MAQSMSEQIAERTINELMEAIRKAWIDGYDTALADVKRGEVKP